MATTPCRQQAYATMKKSLQCIRTGCQPETQKSVTNDVVIKKSVLEFIIVHLYSRTNVCFTRNNYNEKYMFCVPRKFMS